MMRDERAHEIGHRMGRGTVPMYELSDWDELYSEADIYTYAVYLRGYEKGEQRYRAEAIVEGSE